MSAAIDIQFALDDVTNLPSTREIRRWARAALKGQPNNPELSIRVVGLEEGSALNAKYRRRNGPTNVLSFRAEYPADLNTPLLGDIVICAPLVAKEAKEQEKDSRAHWAHLVIHGVLHLLGHDHEDEVQAAQMERLETAIMRALGYPDPYAEHNLTAHALGAAS